MDRIAWLHHGEWLDRPVEVGKKKVWFVLGICLVPSWLFVVIMGVVHSHESYYLAVHSVFHCHA